MAANSKPTWLQPLRLARKYAREVLRFLLPRDVYFVSFAKAGRTWVRMFLGQYFALAHGIPLTLEFDALRRIHPKVPRIVFSHASHSAPELTELERVVERTAGRAVIYMARDPRDIFVSYYFQRTKRSILDAPDLSGRWSEIAMSELLRNERFGIARIVDHMNLWYRSRDRFARFLLLRYEDCKADAQREFARVLEFLGVENVDPGRVAEAIRFSSFDNMKKMEREGAIDGARMKPGAAQDPESWKVRKGKVGGFREYLNAEDVAFANQHVARLDPGLGYAAEA